MRKIIILLVMSLFAFNGVATAQTIKKKVAVYVTGDTENAYKKVVGSKIVTGVTRSDKYTAVERTADFLSQLTNEQDYQTSGAVSDNQIAKLGQQFGVSYVLIADISEVFEAMFISARMIDVQTAQIINSTEASQVVADMSGLTTIAEEVVLGIVGKSNIKGDRIKLLGSFSTFKSLEECKVPEGYHIATRDEIVNILNDYKLTGKSLSFPLYADVLVTYESHYQEYEYKSYDGDVYHHGTHTWYSVHLTCTLFNNETESSLLDLSYIKDDEYYQIASRNYYLLFGNYNKNTTPPNITQGYVYVIKDE